MILLNAMLIDEQSYQGRVRARASPTKHWISEREFQVSRCHFAQVWKMGGSNGPIFREKVCVLIFFSLSLFYFFLNFLFVLAIRKFFHFHDRDRLILMIH